MFLPRATYRLHAIWWFWLPVTLWVTLVAVNPFLSVHGGNIVYSENGLLEFGQVIIAIGSVALGIACLKYARHARLLTVWLALAVLGNFYIAGEELSWGQQLFFWETPEAMMRLNDQQETNLHNMSNWFDQKPKTLLMIGIILGGGILPLLKRFRPKLAPLRFGLVYPPDCLFWVSALTLATHGIDKLKKLNGTVILHRASELTEFYMYYFMLLYLLMMLWTLKDMAARGEKPVFPKG